MATTASNTLLTPDMITKECLMILHEKLTFTGSINRQYDNRFANEGGKIGDTLRIRKPARYIVTDGATLTVQDSVDENTSVAIDTRKHVGMNFTTQDLTLNIDQFRERYIDPAMSALAASVEADIVSRATMAAQSYVGTAGTVPTALSTYLEGRTILNERLAPKDSNRNVMVTSRMGASIIDSLKALFNDSKELSSQYREGVMGRTAGLDWAESEYAHNQNTGSHTFASTAVNATIATNGTDTIVIKGMGASKTVKAGERFTIAGVYDVHPETKATRAQLKQFVVVEDATSTAGGQATLTVSPSMSYTADGRQNISAAPAEDAVLVWMGAADKTYSQGLIYHRDAFTFGSADLKMPQGVDMASRQNYDGISLRLVRQYDINKDELPCRIDVLYGFGQLYPDWAVTVTS